MGVRRFCNLENRAFDATDFATDDRGVTVHVLSETSGHTLDGWSARLKAARADDGTWTVMELQIKQPVVPRPPSFGR